MAMFRQRRSTEQDPFTDLLFNSLLAFTFLFLVAIMFLNPPAKQGIIDPKAEVIITMQWPDNTDDDIDLWVEDPKGRIVWFKNTEAGLMHLDRDDRGMANDMILVDGETIANPLNQEVVTIRGTSPGEYVVNTHYFYAASDLPVDVEVKVVRVNPKLEVIYYGTLQLPQVGNERTAVRFTVTRDGSIINVNRRYKSLAPVEAL